MSEPLQLSIVVITWNEERNIRACLASLARQRELSFEVIVVDAHSDDATARLVAEARVGFPVPLRFLDLPRRAPIGLARNRGVAVAQAPNIAFLSADAELDADWVGHALESLASKDLVFGRQVHAPHRWTLGAAVRGLRYHFPDGPARDPLPYSSNVAAAYRRPVLAGLPFDPWANAAEDLLLAQRATRLGFVSAYNPTMVVRHHDVASAGEELRKNLREGRGRGLYVRELGLFKPFLAWMALLVAAVGLLAVPHVPPAAAIAIFLAILWAPTLRRAGRNFSRVPFAPLLAAVAASPFFDLAFLVGYVNGLAISRKANPQIHPRPSA